MTRWLHRAKWLDLGITTYASCIYIPESIPSKTKNSFKRQTASNVADHRLGDGFPTTSSDPEYSAGNWNIRLKSRVGVPLGPSVSPLNVPR